MISASRVLVILGLVLAVATAVSAKRSQTRDEMYNPHKFEYRGTGGKYDFDRPQGYNDKDSRPERLPLIPRDWSEIPKEVTQAISDEDYPQDREAMEQYHKDYIKKIAEERKAAGTYNAEDFRGRQTWVNGESRRDVMCKKRGLEGDACRIADRKEQQERRHNNAAKAKGRHVGKGKKPAVRKGKKPAVRKGKTTRKPSGKRPRKVSGCKRGADGRFRSSSGSFCKKPAAKKGSGCKKGADGRYRAGGRFCKKKSKFGTLKKGLKKGKSATAKKAKKCWGSFFGAAKKGGRAVKKGGRRVKKGGRRH
jgi:hypothetical protein